VALDTHETASQGGQAYCNTIIRLVKDDLTAMDVDAFVFYAREDLELGSGYGSAIQQRSGVAVKKELDNIGSIAVGEAVITGAGALKARHIIHACGPKFHEPDLEDKLRRTVRSTLRIAADEGVKTLAIPPMGTGFYGVPMALSIRVMLEEVRSFIEGETPFEQVIVCANDKRDFDTVEKLFGTL